MIGRKKKSKLPIIIVIVLLLGVIVFLYFHFNKKEEPVKPIEKKDEVVDTFKIQYEDNMNFENKLVICSEEDNVFNKIGNDEACNRLKINIKSESDNTEFYGNKEDYYVYSDNNIIKIYDRNKDLSINTKLSSTEYKYNSLSLDGNEVKGIVLLHEKEKKYYEFYSIRQSKIIYESEYTDIMYPLDCGYLSVITSLNGKQNKALLLSTMNEEILLEQSINNKNSNELYYYEMIGKNFISLNYKNSDVEHKIAYNLKLKEVDRDFEKYTETTSGKLMVSKGNIVYIYNSDCIVEKRIDNYPTILEIYEDYILILQNENVYLLDINDKVIDLHIKLRNKEDYIFLTKEDMIMNIYIKNIVVTPDKVIKTCKETKECNYTNVDELKDCTMAVKNVYDLKLNRLDTVPYAICED